MNKLEQTWRWYGPNDPVSLDDIKQAGATGIVTALHHIPHGDIWPIEDILARKKMIEDQGLVWSVVESVPVHEAIKTRNQDAEKYLDNYKKSLENLAKCGIKIITYNFMPVLDWTRTQLDLMMKDGSKALYFDWIDLAIFDIYVLKRELAAEDYSEEILKQVAEKISSYAASDFEELARIVLMGIPGENDISLTDLNKSIAIYSKIGRKGLLENLLYFLSSISEICEREGIKMSIHPDDPPYSILGLPRIVSNQSDLSAILEGVDKPFNGICFCTGSLGASQTNHVASILEKVKDRVYFAHLRNVRKDHIGSFYEADHIDGDVNMYAVMKVLCEENQNRTIPIPFRPDHGHQMLDDLKKVSNPGYSAIGRLRGLAELRGLEYGILGE
ncbi:mannonate dehydratase [Sphingobacterium sp. SRCM116780]|uniref:mannonate dehydratase n=1 Tax=Sphingobacterium sp. SRCM116780 TaxID=2907623 RepID=UPI001F2A8518|nr:mannonate dehydratase [Sphingobacterium sp. SRCM116780]UIR56401.1 mannonate dehydratase [Sphingobacterium sp. SRCM116780]